MLIKEKLSVKTPYFHINNLPEGTADLDTDQHVYRLLKINRLMNHLQMKHAVPYMMKSFSSLHGFRYDDLKNKYTKLEDRSGHFFKIRLDSQKNASSEQDNFILYHSALYRVEYLKFRPVQQHNGS